MTKKSTTLQRNTMSEQEIAQVAMLVLQHGAEPVMETVFATLDIVTALDTSSQRPLWEKFTHIVQHCMNELSRVNTRAPSFKAAGAPIRKKVLGMLREAL